MKFSNLLIRFIGLCALFASSLLGQEPGPQKADLILHNGKILTVDDNFSTADAVAVSGQRILAVGRDADILKLAGSSTQVIDLKGRMAIPGLVDTHRHIYAYAEATYGRLSRRPIRRRTR